MFLLSLAKISPNQEQQDEEPIRNHTPAFKAKVAIAALKGDKTTAELAEKFDVHANQITQGKTQFLACTEGVHDIGREASGAGRAIGQGLQAKIGQLSLEVDLLAGALGRLDVWTLRAQRNDRPKAHPVSVG